MQSRDSFNLRRRTDLLTDYHVFPQTPTEQVSVTVTLHISISEVPGSNLLRASGYPMLCFHSMST
jgi:hypothetical protein